LHIVKERNLNVIPRQETVSKQRYQLQTICSY